MSTIPNEKFGLSSLSFTQSFCVVSMHVAPVFLALFSILLRSVFE